MMKMIYCVVCERLTRHFPCNANSAATRRTYQCQVCDAVTIGDQ